MLPNSIPDADFQRFVIECKQLPAAKGNYLVHDYVENMMLTVLDFQMHGVTIERAIRYYYQNAREEVADFTGLKRLLAAHADNQEGNTQVAQFLWGNNHWTRVALLRRLLRYFGAEGITTQEKLKDWAAKADFERDFQGRVKGAGFAIFQWLVMRQGVETVKPDVWIQRFIREKLGYSVGDKLAVELIERAAVEIGVKAYELDWRIWEHQSGR